MFLIQMKTPVKKINSCSMLKKEDGHEVKLHTSARLQAAACNLYMLS